MFNLKDYLTEDEIDTLKKSNLLKELDIDDDLTCERTELVFALLDYIGVYKTTKGFYPNCTYDLICGQYDSWDDFVTEDARMYIDNDDIESEFLTDGQFDVNKYENEIKHWYSMGDRGFVFRNYRYIA